jgi:hypothetical protein
MAFYETNIDYYFYQRSMQENGNVEFQKKEYSYLYFSEEIWTKELSSN